MLKNIRRFLTAVPHAAGGVRLGGESPARLRVLPRILVWVLNGYLAR